MAKFGIQRVKEARFGKSGDENEPKKKNQAVILKDVENSRAQLISDNFWTQSRKLEGCSHSCQISYDRHNRWTFFVGVIAIVSYGN